MSIFKALWNWRRNARETREDKFWREVEDKTLEALMETMRRAERESSRMKAMG